MATTFVHEGDALPKSSPNQLLTLRRVKPADCSNAIVARSYSGLPWAGVLPDPLQPRCDNKTGACTLVSSKSSFVYRVDTVHRGGDLNTNQSAVRFLLQSTFGATRADISALRASHASGAQDTLPDKDTRVFEAWFDKQVALPPTLLRSYYRERSNPRQTQSNHGGTPIQRCGLGSRWLRFAFDIEDLHKPLSVRNLGVFWSRMTVAWALDVPDLLAFAIAKQATLILDVVVDVVRAMPINRHV